MFFHFVSKCSFNIFLMTGLFVQRAGDSAALGAFEVAIKAFLSSYISNFISGEKEFGFVLSLNRGFLSNVFVSSVNELMFSCFFVIHLISMPLFKALSHASCKIKSHCAASCHGVVISMLSRATSTAFFTLLTHASFLGIKINLLLS